MDCSLALILTILFGAALYGLLQYLRQPRWRCRNCGSRQVGLISKDPQGMRSVDMHTGGAGGGYSGIQTTYIVTYQCNTCHFQWSDTITETT